MASGFPTPGANAGSSTSRSMLTYRFSNFSVKFCKSDDSNMLKRFLSLTILCGLLFFVFQVLGWKDLVDNGKFLSGNNVASSYLYVLTLTHFVHLVGGVVALLVIFFQSLLLMDLGQVTY